MNELKYVGCLFLGKLMAFGGAAVGLLLGILYAFGGAFMDYVSSGSLNLGSALAFFAILGMPVIFATCGFIFGALTASVYNWCAVKITTIDADFRID